MQTWRITNAVPKMNEHREQWHLQGHQFCRFQAYTQAVFEGKFVDKPAYKLAGLPEGLEITSEPGWQQVEIGQPVYNGFEFDDQDSFWTADQRNRVTEMWKSAGNAGLQADGCVLISTDCVLLGPLKLYKV